MLPAFICTIILSFFTYLVNGVGFVRPLEDMEAYFITTKLPSIYTFRFTLDSGLRSSDYIRVKFANYTSVSSPICLFAINSTHPNTAATCVASSNSVYVTPASAITKSID